VKWFGVEYINGDQQERSAVICHKKFIVSVVRAFANT